MNYYYRHIGDYIRDTSHLSLLEHGIYSRLMDLYYITEQPLDDATVVRLVGARTEDERKALEAVLNDFFELSGGLWSQRRCEAEIAAYKGKAKTNQENGKLGGRPKTTQPKPTGNPDGSQTASESNPNQEPITNNQEPITKKERDARATRLPAPFVLDEAWEAWGRSERPDLNLKTTAAKFADHWHSKPGKDGLKLDWFATWRNWVRAERMNPADVVRVTVPGPPPSSFLAEQAAHRAQVEAERIARKQREAA